MKKPRKLLTPVLILLVLTAAGQVTLGQDTEPSPSGADIIKSVAVIKLPASRFVADSAEASRSGEARQPEPAATSLLNRVGVQTQDSLALSLDDAIRMALENNNNIELTRDDVRFQETQIRAISGAYDPVLTVSPTYTRNSTTGVTSTNDFNVNSSLSQLLRSGGNYTGFFNNSRTENVFAQAQVSSGALGSGGTSAIYSSSYGVRFVQPLMRNFGIDNTRRNLKIARRRLEQTDADFRRQTIDTIAQVQRTYWDLVFALRDQQNRQANLELTRESLRQIEARIEAGAAAPLARAEVETELANRESDVLVATQQVSIVENNLKQLLLRDPLSNQWSQSFMPTDRPAFTLDPIEMEAAVKDAIENRHELRRLKLAADINEIDIDYFRNQTKPQIDLNGTISMNGLARSGSPAGFETNLFTAPGDLILLNAINANRQFLNTPTLPQVPNPVVVVPPQPDFLYGGIGRSLGNTFRSDAPNYSIGVTISFPFRNRTARANLAGAQVQRDQIATQLRAQEQTVIVEVRNAVQAVDTARQRVLTARRARENAEIQLEGERRLYESGRSTTFLLFQRENTLTNARNAEIRAETDYNKALADLQRATSTTFSANNIEVISPGEDN
jgi:outer membrane protein TolC